MDLAAVTARLAAGHDAALVGAEYERALGNGRKKSGSYYTPDPLVTVLLDGALDPLLEARADPLSLRVLDPACGTGNVLVRAAERIAARSGVAIERVAAECIYGFEPDPVAHAICVKRLGGCPHVLCADALSTKVDLRFDAVVGNPPFQNAIENNVPQGMRVRGAVDLAYVFLERSIEWVKPGGRVGLVQPRAMLNSPAAVGLRRSVRPNLIYAPSRSNLFPGALVFACIVVIGQDAECRISCDPDAATARWVTKRMEDENWWFGMQQALGRAGEARMQCVRFGDTFEIVGSMTAGEAYDLKPFVLESPEGDALKLVTTGLIDPGECKWGRMKCRYLGLDYDHPRVVAGEGMKAALVRRLERARRPKIIVAGLTKKIECFVDERGEYTGAVSTFSLFDPRNNLPRLRMACEWLLSLEADCVFRTTLGANAVGGGDTVMKKTFLRALPWPA